MKSNCKFVLATMVMATSFGFGSAPACAQTTAPGPYYATPSWDQTLAPAARFIVLSNFNAQAILDRETGLVWERTPSSGSTPVTWDQAASFCLRNTIAGRMGWRLPSINELTSLVDGLTLPTGHPFIGVVSGVPYWSATAFVNFGGNQGGAWAYFFGSGGAGIGTPSKSGTELFWCVRSSAVLENY